MSLMVYLTFNLSSFGNLNARVLYFSLHRFDDGTFYPCLDDAGPTYVGDQDASGFNVNVAWNKHEMGDAEYLSAFHHLLMPISLEVDTHIVHNIAGLFCSDINSFFPF